MFLRRGTYDELIEQTVHVEYLGTPQSFRADQVVLDVGCHIGAFSRLAAGRGARVIGYEANRENYRLACLNTAEHERATIRHGAIWRSDRPAGVIHFVPSTNVENTGGGTVLFDSLEAARAMFVSRDGVRSTVAAPDLPSPHDVRSVPLDAVLEALGDVQLLKIDAEGVEFPVLMTAQRLRQVAMIVGEFHEFNDVEMSRMTAEARVGNAPYSLALLIRTLAGAGFNVTATRSVVDFRRGLFAAKRRS
ncbi:MAG: FkbM family methyltransferase [Vicinamibacterales bacterium]